MTDRAFVVARNIFKVNARIKANKSRVAAALHDAAGFHGGTNRTGFATVRVDEDLGTRDTRFNIINLGLNGGQVCIAYPLEGQNDDPVRPCVGSGRHIATRSWAGLERARRGALPLKSLLFES